MRSFLERKLKRALVQARVANHLPAHARAQDGFEHILLEPADDRVMLEQIHNGRMAFKNPWPAVFVVDELGHVAFAITEMSEPLRAFSHRISLCFGLERRGLLFKDVVEELFRRIWSVDFFGRFQEVQSELVTVGLKQIVAPTRQPIDHLWPTHSLRPTPGVQITVAVKSDAMLLDAHVAHAHSVHELVDGHSPGALERVNNLKPLSTANFRNQTLIHMGKLG